MEGSAEEVAAYAVVEERAKKARQRLAVVKNMVPYAQGELDNFCGIYAAVNGVRLVAAGRKKPLTMDRSAMLLLYGTDFLEARKKLGLCVRHGLRWQLWCKLVEAVAQKAQRSYDIEVAVDRPFLSFDHVPKDVFEKHVRNAIRGRQPVLIRIEGQQQHYSVICGISDKRLRLPCERTSASGAKRSPTGRPILGRVAALRSAG